MLIQKAIKQEKKNSPNKYTNADFFKSIRPKAYIDDYFRRMGDEINEERVRKLKIIDIDE